jgi:hypothetical protein
MPRNPNKRRCKVEGCHAWAMHGESLCSSHMRSHSVQERSNLILPLLRAVANVDEGACLDDLRVIDEELRKLFAARAYFQAWVEELREMEAKGGVSPAQFLRAWNESTSRVIQLLRARRDLGGGKDDAFGDLMAEVFDELEKELALEARQP